MSNALNLGDIILPGSGYPNLFGFNFPVLGGLEGLFLLANGEDPKKNYAPGKPDATVIGSPVVSSAFTTFGGANYLDTGIAETAEMTFIMAVRDAVSGAVNVGYAGNFFASPNFGVAIYSPIAGGQLQAMADRTGSSSGAGSLVAADLTTFKMFSYRIASDKSRLKNLTTGVISESVSGAREVSGSGPILLGRLPLSGYSETHDQGFAAILSRALTDAELTLIEAWGRSYMDAQGITV